VVGRPQGDGLLGRDAGTGQRVLLGQEQAGVQGQVSGPPSTATRPTGGLIGLLAFFAGVSLLFTGR
jgi:hypothetical protein